MDPVSGLLTDSERRLREAPRPPLDLGSLKRKARAARVTELIDRLEDVSVVQWSQPGSVEPAQDQICELLVAEGEAVVEPMIAVLENDKRLTRSVGYGRDFHLDRFPVSARGAAAAVLAEIFQLPSVLDHANPEKLRSWWRENKDRTLAERCFYLLADDHSTTNQWFEAVSTLVRPQDVVLRRGWWTTPKHEIGKSPPAMVGEPLRTRSEPSVSDLIRWRVSEYTAQFADNGCIMAKNFSLWDPDAAQPVLHAIADVSDYCRKIISPLLRQENRR